MNVASNINSKQIIESLWRDQSLWSETANRLKAELFRWRYRAALAGVVGAVFETLAASLVGLGENWWWLRVFVAVAGAVILAIVPYVLRTKASKERVREWVRARSASEALKELIYRYLLGAPPFTLASSSDDLIERSQAVKEKVEDLRIHAASVESEQTVGPVSMTVDEYVKNRVNDQIDGFYVPKGREKARLARRLHNLEFGLGLVAVVLAALVSAGTAADLSKLAILGPWVAVVTTAGAAASAYLAAARYDHEAIIYFGTSDRLTSLRNKWLGDTNRLDPDRIAKFVDNCEHAISTENESWLAKLTGDQSETP